MASGTVRLGARNRPFITSKVPLPSERIRRVPILVRAKEEAQPVRRARAPRTAHEYPAWNGAAPALEASPQISPKELYRVLEAAPFVHVNFDTEKQLDRFRYNLYKVNIEGEFRYATRREGWLGLVILRLK